MLQGALSGLAAKAKAAAAKAGDAVGDFLDNSVDNPLYEDEEAEWSDEDEDEDEEDLDGDEDDGTDSPAPAPTQSSALAQLRARLAAERAKKAGASVAVVGGIFSATGASPRAVEPTAFGDTIGAVARVGADSTFSSAAVFCLSAFPRRARGARGGIAKARRDAPPDASPPRLGMAARARSEEAGGTFRIVVAVGRLASAGK